jgi:glyceraldehyde-3-phosphate dehydrogenase (NADP+)
MTNLFFFFLFLNFVNTKIFLPDLFSGEPISKSYLDAVIDEALLGALSYNGQRCTALKLLLVPRPYAEQVGQLLVERFEKGWNIGLPWQKTNDSYPKITPLPNQDRVSYMQRLIQDAVGKGAKILNPNGGTIIGSTSTTESNDSGLLSADSSTLMVPAILYPVTPDMDVYNQEQFGPIVPIVPYDDIEEVLNIAKLGLYGQQVSIFTSDPSASNSPQVAQLLDRMASIFGKINLNQQCGRSPDTLPFSGRRSSALGVMSVSHVLQEFSVPVVVAYKDHKTLNGNPVDPTLQSLQAMSTFLE